jgi:CarD family transcriptional regulator
MEDKDFVVGQYVIYPSHGLGQIAACEEQDIAGFKLELLVIAFEKDRMLLRIPLNRAKASGLRPLSSPAEMAKALGALRGVPSKKILWSRRVHEYETKINSGNPLFLAEVIRDLHKSDQKTDQTYGERQIYQAAIERFTRELAAVEHIDPNTALEKIEKLLKVA